MLKNLKRKFIVTNMLLVGIVLLVVFIFICTTTYNNQMKEINRTLKQPITSRYESEGKLGYMTSIIVVTDENANIYQTYVRGASMEKGSLAIAVSEAVAHDENKGKIGSLSLFFEKKALNNGQIIVVFVDASRMDQIVWSVSEAVAHDENKGKIGSLSLFFEKKALNNGQIIVVFVDASRMDQIVWSTIVTSGITFIIAMVIVYFISMFIASLAIKPVQQSWKQQKRFVADASHTIVTSGITFIIAMVIVYFISMFIASLAIKPVQQSWKQQKRFVADASHELKTPLTVILANNEILRGKKDKTIAEEKQWIDSTIEEAKHMKKLVEDMLFLAKNDSADIRIEKTEVNISELAEGDMLQFEPVAYEAGVTLDSKIDEDFKLIADGTQMKQLLHILIDNGIKYAISEVEPKVQLEIVNNQRKEIIVRNTCKEIPKEQIEHLFDRFYRGDAARTRVELDSDVAAYGLGGGYGLGLAIAKTIVENHNGTISVKSDKTAGPDGSEGIEFKVIFR